MKAKNWCIFEVFKKLGYKNVKLSSTFGSLNKKPYNVYEFPIRKAIESKLKKRFN
jgi:hypothetical protein